MQILFYDPLTPSVYDAATPLARALGGTEATVIRVAEALKERHDVFVAQHCRLASQDQRGPGVNYISFETTRQLSPDVVILLRQYRMTEEVARLFPKARRYLWLHNMPSRELYSARDAMLKHGYQVIAVSQFHRAAIERRMRGGWLRRLFPSQKNPIPIKVIYNPIADSLRADATPVKRESLLFMSSPQKGLAQTLKMFEAVQRQYPEYELLIANPGYSRMELILPKQARFLGALPHQQVIQQLREVFCVFYPQTERVETFGLIYAEANAVGTPVLAHDAGAAREVLSDAGQLVNGHQLSSVLDKLTEWRQKRPQLAAREEFRLSQVISQWLKLLG